MRHCHCNSVFSHLQTHVLNPGIPCVRRRLQRCILRVDERDRTREIHDSAPSLFLDSTPCPRTTQTRAVRPCEAANARIHGANVCAAGDESVCASRVAQAQISFSVSNAICNLVRSTVFEGLESQELSVCTCRGEERSEKVRREVQAGAVPWAHSHTIVSRPSTFGLRRKDERVFGTSSCVT